MSENKKLDNAIKFIEEYRLERKLTDDEKFIAEKIYYIARQHHFNEIMDKKYGEDK
jgi:hypothetical protein